MASDPTDLIRRLAGGLRAFAGGPVVGATAPEQWQDFTRRALDHVGIETNKAQFERAWRTLWRRAFMGGNYTLDAKAILAAIHDEPTQENKS